jgi:4-carboxymuconolactone decarboxylase
MADVPRELYDKGLAIRREVLGDDYVDQALARADEFTAPLQEFVTAYAWGAAWGRETLPRHTRSLINVALLTALGKPQELRTHVRGAITNGATVEEVREVLLHCAAYCGAPAAVDAFRHARDELVALGLLGGGEPA